MITAWSPWVAEERADSADYERRDRVEDYRRGADNYIIEIQVAARNGNAERAHRDIERHEHCRQTYPQRGSFRVAFLFHFKVLLAFLTGILYNTADNIK